jgi:hypothetical protein
MYALAMLPVLFEVPEILAGQVGELCSTIDSVFNVVLA